MQVVSYNVTTGDDLLQIVVAVNKELDEQGGVMRFGNTSTALTEPMEILAVGQNGSLVQGKWSSSICANTRNLEPMRTLWTMAMLYKTPLYCCPLCLTNSNAGFLSSTKVYKVLMLAEL